MNLLAPFALWGLLALSVPILLHLRRRRVGRTIQVGSLKHLETLPTAERRGPRVRDPLRLLLRLTILGLVVFLLAEPMLPLRSEGRRVVVLADTSALPALRDSLTSLGDLLPGDLASPWDAIVRADDSLPPGVDLVVAAPITSDLFEGPRPVVHRDVRWITTRAIQHTAPRTQHAPSTQNSAPSTLPESRALAAAVGAVAEELGPLTDTMGWQARLPDWWRDSLATPAFPIAVARAIAPARALPLAVELAPAQLQPRMAGAHADQQGARPLHWWLWGLAFFLFVIERLWARRLEGTG